MPKGQAAIVTIVDHHNFGNRLQNFALQEALGSLGWTATTIRNAPPPMARGLLVSRGLHALGRDGFVEFVKRNGGRLGARLRRAPASEAPEPRLMERRRAAMAEFTRAHIASTKESYDELPAASWRERFDVAVVGSDQVWNHGFRNAQEIDFLTFLPPSRRIAYAASFGVAAVPEYLRRRYKSWLSGIPHLSVREERGAEIVAELTGREVPVVVDPALLFDAQYWREFAGLQEEHVAEPFGVQFFLGRAAPEQTAWVADYAAERNLRLRDVADVSNMDSAILDPQDFVRSLAVAAFVATDSFHTALFALQFRRPIIVRSRDETDVRLHTLLNLHGITAVATAVPGVSVVDDVDWATVEQTIRARRDESWEFLRASLASAAQVGKP